MPINTLEIGSVFDFDRTQPHENGTGYYLLCGRDEKKDLPLEVGSVAHQLWLRVNNIRIGHDDDPIVSAGTGWIGQGEGARPLRIYKVSLGTSRRVSTTLLDAFPIIESYIADTHNSGFSNVVDSKDLPSIRIPFIGTGKTGTQDLTEWRDILAAMDTSSLNLVLYIYNEEMKRRLRDLIAQFPELTMIKPFHELVKSNTGEPQDQYPTFLLPNNMNRLNSSSHHK